MKFFFIALLFINGHVYAQPPRPNPTPNDTLQSVRNFQKANNIRMTGFVGPLTRAALLSTDVSSSPVSQPLAGEYFEGTITASSVGCFVDGECSITVDGKKVVTTTGRSQQVVGVVKGIPDFGSIEQKTGSHAKVYAAKTPSGYTLYGNVNFYIEVQ